MLKRYAPLQIPNGTIKTFELPASYIGGDITLFVNGQLLPTRNDTEHPFGYILDEINKTFTFYIAPYETDTIYIIYDSDGESTTGGSGDGALGSGVLRLEPGYTLISYAGANKAIWSKEQGTVIYPENILANIVNLWVTQIEDRYGVPATEIIREFQTYRDDFGQYRQFIPGSTNRVWTNDGEHVRNPELYRPATAIDQGDPNLGDNVYYNPDNFVLSNTSLTEDNNIISNDSQNPISDLPMGNRSGIHVFIFNNPVLSKTNGLLELYF